MTRLGCFAQLVVFATALWLMTVLIIAIREAQGFGNG